MMEMEARVAAVMVADQTVDMPAHFRAEWADPSVNLWAYT
jgi:hypothetical protein